MRRDAFRGVAVVAHHIAATETHKNMGISNPYSLALATRKYVKDRCGDIYYGRSFHGIKRAAVSGVSHTVTETSFTPASCQIRTSFWLIN